MLGAAGYATGAFVSGWPLRHETLGIEDRFHVYDDDFRDWRLLPDATFDLAFYTYVRRVLQRLDVAFYARSRDATRATDAALQWLPRHAGRPYFAWVHYYDPHLPYEAPQRDLPEEARSYSGPADGGWYALDAETKREIVADPEAIAQMHRLYDAEVAHVDTALGRLLAQARASAPPAGLLVVVTSDHGESLGEHALYFLRDLYEPTLHVPLLIEAPPGRGIAAGEVEAPVGLVDLLPTIVDLLGVARPDSLAGRSLVPEMMQASTSPAPSDAAVISYLHTSRESALQESVAIRTDDWKLIERRAGWHGNYWQRAGRELYDLRSDPNELHNVLDRFPDKVAELSARLAPYALEDRPTGLELTPTQLTALRALGYLD